jgi:nitrate/nitrite transporter NarK
VHQHVSRRSGLSRQICSLERPHAAGIALINSVGNIGGFASTFVVGWLTDLTHSTSASLYLFAGLLVVSALLLLTIPAREINK